MSIFRCQSFASKQRVSFRPQLEILEGKDLPSIGGVIQALGNVVSDAGRVAGDFVKSRLAESQAAFDKNTGLGDQQQAQQAVQAAQQALGNDEAQLGKDLSNMFQNMLSFKNIPPSPSQTSTSQSSTSQAAVPASQPSQHLDGNLQGSYTIAPWFPDTGTQYDLSGSGYIQSLGQVTATGELHSIGFIPNGHATGTLTLQNANGTVTLQLVGPSQPGFAPLPNHFHYTIVSATGAYTGMQGSGAIDLHLQPNSSGSGGTFTFKLHSQGDDSQNASGNVSLIDAFFQAFNSMLKTQEAMELNMAGNNAQIEALFRMFNSALGSLESEITGHPISI